ncbi:M10 family metallopeptidase C-terminal domain-containing protein [Rhodobacter sp. NSM]|uniref:M10 family metallopeptidase C-terminal domain-containing protein n=1 Tax=Rhodobacter sp. NSM TaxID=3457501 RepID=UPI003FD5FDE0
MYRIATATSGDDRLGSVVTTDHFGVNFLFDRDRLGPGDTYLQAVRDLGVSTIRYPGGTLSERMFDLANPNGSLQNFVYGDRTNMFDPDRDGPSRGSTLGLWDALDAAGAAGLSMTFVMPTIRFAGTVRNRSGNRQEAVDEALVGRFTTQLLEHALSAGVEIPAIELGNEWWADSSSIFGETLSAVEYGRIASRLAAVIQSTIDAFRASHDLPRDWVEPEIVVQVGPGGRAEQVLPNGGRVPEGYTGPTVSATSLIFREFDTAAEQRAVDGVVTHRYLTGTSVDGWAYNPFDTWDRMAARNPTFGEMSRHVSEWNVSARHEGISGLLMAPWLVSLFAEAVEAGVDRTNIWSVQQNNPTRLSTTTGHAGETYGGLTVAGETLRIMNEELLGLQVLDLRAASGRTMVEAFGSDSRTVIFISNTTGSTLTGDFDISDVASGYSHVWATEIGMAGSDPLADGGCARTQFLTAGQLMDGNVLSLSLGAYETICVEVTLDRSGVEMNGRSLNDRLVGSSAGDVIRGGGGHDRLTGGAGADRLQGGSGNDKLAGGSGNDVLSGGSGNDRLSGNLGADHLTGGSGADVFVFESLRASCGGRSTRDTITDFARGTDHINLAAIDADTGVRGNQAFTFIGRAAFSGEAGELRCLRHDGGTLIQGDVSGDGRADLRIFLDDPMSLRASDFLL